MGKRQNNTKRITDPNRYLNTMYVETAVLSFMTARINLLNKGRVDELVALRWDDYNGEDHIHIVCEEVRNQNASKYLVEEHTKTNSDSFAVLVPKAISLLKSIPKDSKNIYSLAKLR